MKWRSRKTLPSEDDDRLTLVFCPVYPVGNPVRMRIMGARFVRVCEDVESWCYLDDIEPKKGKR